MARFVKVLESAARTTSVDSPYIDSYGDNDGAHIVVDVTEISGVNVVPVVKGFDQTSRKSYTILAGSVITTTGTTVLKVGPEFTAAANVAKDYIPYSWYVSVTVSGGGPGATFSVGASMV